jgi:hypothetical protein
LIEERIPNKINFERAFMVGGMNINPFYWRQGWSEKKSNADVLLLDWMISSRTLKGSSRILTQLT